MLGATMHGKESPGWRESQQSMGLAGAAALAATLFILSHQRCPQTWQ